MLYVKSECRKLAVLSFILAVALAMCVGTVYAKSAGKQLYKIGTPTRAIQDLDAKMGKFIVKKKGKKLTSKDEAFNKNLKEEIIHGTFDVRELARLALARHWKEITQEQRNDFVNTLTSLLEQKALFSKEQSASRSKNGGKYNVIYLGQRYMDKAHNRAFVRTRVIVPSENVSIKLNYKMKKRGAGEWKIYDIIVDEASLVDNYRYQFNNIINKNGYKDLIRRMKDKLNSLEAKRTDTES